MQTLKSMVVGSLFTLTSLWVLLFIWVHQPFSVTLASAFILVWIVLVGLIFYIYKKQPEQRAKVLTLYFFAFCVVLLIFFSMTAKNDRIWRPENTELMNFRFVDGQVEIDNVRNFIWQDNEQYEVQWEKRRYRLDDLQSVDLVISHFIPGPIAHVFVSFGFANGEYLSLSLEVREELGEGFSTIGGFFRQYELALVVGDENDLIFSRTNIRGEELYIYPLKMEQIEIQMMFLEYLNKANRLRHQPRWYNTLVSNCTTILFDLTEHATGSIPRDYRVLLPGLLPSYLYDHGLVSQAISLEQWRKMAHVNPKTKHLNTGLQTENTNFSKLIRQDLPRLESSTALNESSHSSAQHSLK